MLKNKSGAACNALILLCIARTVGTMEIRFDCIFSVVYCFIGIAVHYLRGGDVTVVNSASLHLYFLVQLLGSTFNFVKCHVTAFEPSANCLFQLYISENVMLR